MKQAANFQKFRLPMLLPGITVCTSPTDFYPIQAVQLQRFKGETWELFGDVMHAEAALSLLPCSQEGRPPARRRPLFFGRSISAAAWRKSRNF